MNIKSKILVLSLANFILLFSNDIKFDKVHRIYESEVNKVRKSLISKVNLANKFTYPILGLTALTGIGMYYYPKADNNNSGIREFFNNMSPEQQSSVINKLKAKNNKDHEDMTKFLEAFNTLDETQKKQIFKNIVTLKQPDNSWSAWWNNLTFVRWLKEPTVFLFSLPFYLVSTEVNNKVMRIFNKVYKNFLNPEFSFNWYLNENTSLLQSIKNLNNYVSNLTEPDEKIRFAVEMLQELDKKAKKNQNLTIEEQNQAVELTNMIKAAQEEEREDIQDRSYIKERLHAECSNCMFELEKVLGYITFTDNKLINDSADWQRMAINRKRNFMIIVRIKQLAEKFCDVIDREMENINNQSLLKTVYDFTTGINQELENFLTVEKDLLEQS